MRYPGTFWPFFHNILRVNVNNSFNLSVPNTFQYQEEYFHYVFDFNDPKYNTPYGESLKMIWLIPVIAVPCVLFIIFLTICGINLYKQSQTKQADNLLQTENGISNNSNNRNNNNNNNTSIDCFNKRLSKKHLLCLELILLIFLFLLGFFIYHTIFIFFWPDYDTTIFRYNKKLNDTNIKVKNIANNVTTSLHGAYDDMCHVLDDNHFLKDYDGICVKFGVYDPIKDLYKEVEELKSEYDSFYKKLNHDFEEIKKALTVKQLDASDADPIKEYMWQLVVTVFSVVGTLILLKYIVLMVKKYKFQETRVKIGNTNTNSNNSDNENSKNSKNNKRIKWIFFLWDKFSTGLIFLSLYGLWFGLWFECSGNALFSDICHNPHGMIYQSVNTTTHHRRVRISVIDYYLFDCQSFWYKTNYSSNTLGNDSNIFGPLTFVPCNVTTMKYPTECVFVSMIEKTYIDGQALVIGTAASKSIFDKSINSPWCINALS